MNFANQIVMTLLYLVLFPLAFVWLRRAWRIFINKDYSEVALKRGEGPPNPKAWAPATGLINLVAGCVASWVIVGLPVWIATGILLGPFRDNQTWYAIAGSTIWVKLFADFIVSRQAHPFILGRKKKSDPEVKS